MTEILQSIKPKWCELIISGKKTIEVRKRRPKCITPFKVYIYCTKPRFPHEDFIIKENGLCIEKAFYAGGKVIGEYVCDRIYTYQYLKEKGEYDRFYWFPDHRSKSCLSEEDMLTYGDGKTLLYAYHISDLKIYDVPKELSEFEIRKYNDVWNIWKKIERAPQDWCYVEKREVY